MNKLPFAAFSFLALLAGCAAEVDGTPSEEDIREAQEASITSFFGSGDSTNPLCASGAPVEKNLTWYNGKFFVDAAGSCIMQGATMTVQIPFSTTTYGPYALSWDDSGTRLHTPSLGPTIFPAGTCRMAYITNPNGLTSSYQSACR
jgi:hypothetical protein